MAKRHEPTVLAASAALLCMMLGYLSRDALNPDGVSYLDLATAMQRGDWLQFVQGYWSPLYPLMIGGLGSITGRSGPELVVLTHIINTIAALSVLAVIAVWARRTDDPRGFVRAALAAFLICSAGLPRIEAVTPDVVLLAILAWLAYELVINGGRRWILVGVLIGVAFLTKTSCWPWLLAALPLRWWAATQRDSRRNVIWSTLVAAAIALTWIVPMSSKYGHPTLGSSGALNWSWYIKGNTSRLPDTDGGANTAFHEVGVGNGRLLQLTVFDNAERWTYEPWGDPTAWSTKVVNETGHTPSVIEMLSYWMRMFARTFGLWLGPLIVGTLIPWIVLRRRAAMRQELQTSERDAALAMMLGLVGLLQFVAVHAEPRLIAPFALMLSLGALHWCFAKPAAKPLQGLARQALSWLGIVVAIGFAVPRLKGGIESANRLTGVTAQLGELRRRISLVSSGPLPIAVVGPAAPIMASAYLVNARIAYQLAPAYAQLVATLPREEQNQMLLTLFRGKVPMLWRTSPDGGMEMLIVPEK